MKILLSNPSITVERDSIDSTLLSPAMALPGILFVHGWGGSQAQDLERAREISGLGCVCLTIDLRGHGKDMQHMNSVSRAQNLADLIAAYDWLASRPNVEASAIAVVGISYGGYLAAILSSLRSIRWLALRTPALYKDEHWEIPKKELHADNSLLEYRRRRIEPGENKALRACTEFHGDSLLIEAENDSIIPHAVIENYKSALSNSRSLTSRVITGADHGLSTEESQQNYNSLLISWLTEMISGARLDSAKAQSANSSSSEIKPSDPVKRTDPLKPSDAIKQSDMESPKTHPLTTKPAGITQSLI